MNKQVIEQWATALESGDYAQGKNRLHTITEEGNNEFCCLGVLCEVAKSAGIVDVVGHRLEDQNLVSGEVPEHDDLEGGFTVVLYGSKKGEFEAHSLPPAVAKWAGLVVDGVMDADPTLSHPIAGHHAASYWNDVENSSFNDIATMIRHTYLNDTSDN